MSTGLCKTCGEEHELNPTRYTCPGEAVPSIAAWGKVREWEALAAEVRANQQRCEENHEFSIAGRLEAKAAQLEACALDLAAALGRVSADAPSDFVLQVCMRQVRDALAYIPAERDHHRMSGLAGLSGLEDALRGSVSQGIPPEVTRFEVIDHRNGAPQVGRVFSAWDCRVELSYQDGGHTLKVFVDGDATTENVPPPMPDAERAEKLAAIRADRLERGEPVGGSSGVPEPPLREAAQGVVDSYEVQVRGAPLEVPYLGDAIRSLRAILERL